MIKVLVVDDDALMRFSLCAILKTEHTEVTAVETGGAAVRELGRTTFDACFLDIHLPDISGMEVMMAMRQTSPSTRIAIMTGGGVSDELMASIRKHAQLFLEKPFDLQDAKGFVEQGAVRRVQTSHDGDRAGQALGCSRRACERNPAAKTIRYAVLPADIWRREQELTASVVDVSDTGMGILTLASLVPGQSIEFLNGTGIRRGTVRWSRSDDSEAAYRAGIQYA
jgi:DNA-binding NtrC family response regulator